MDGLCVPLFEHDSCGVGFVASTGGRSHQIVERALEAVANLTHRGAVSADGKTGDGADVYHSGYGRVFLDKEGFDHKDSGGIERGYGGHAQLGQYLKDLPSNTRMWQHESSR